VIEVKANTTASKARIRFTRNLQGNW
jgi:hypothetical protein